MNDEVLLQKRMTVLTQEVMSHFQCIACGCGWSMSDFDAFRVERLLYHLHCPACGIRQRLENPPDWRS